MNGKAKYSVSVILVSLMVIAFASPSLSNSVSVTIEGSITTRESQQTSASHYKAFESGLNYLSNGNRFYQLDNVTIPDFDFLKNHSITHLSIRIYWKSWVDNGTRKHKELVDNYNRLLNLTDKYHFEVQFDFWTKFSENVMPPGLEPFDIIRNDTVKGWWKDFVRNVTTEFRSHDSIESWTMMNEPRVEKGHEATDEEAFYRLWVEQREIMKGIDSRPISIRLALGDSPWSGDFNSTEVFQVCDYIAINEYLDPRNSSDTRWGGNWSTFNNCVSECQNKEVPLIISEFGMNTSTLEDRGEYYSQSLSLFKSKGIQKAYAFAWQSTRPELESFNIYGIIPLTPMFLELVRADTMTVPDDYPTIQEAINAASDGDKIYVRSGTYYENVIVAKALSLEGENRSTTTIDGGRIGNVLEIVVDNVNVTGFTVQNSGSNWPYDFCIDLTSRRNCRIEKCVIKNGGYLVYLAYAHNNTVRNSILTNASSYAIYVYEHATDNAIANNSVTACTNGVGIEEYCEDNTVSYNNISSNDYYGIYLLHSNSNSVANNLLSFNGFINPGLVYPGITLMYSSNNTMAHNTIYSNTGGILVRFDRESLPARYNVIEGNVIANNSYGLILHYGGNQSNPSTGTFNQIHENTLKNNGYGIELIGVDNNTFCHNNILGSVNKQVDTQNLTNAWDNGCEGNYWSNYDGSDLDNDGVGDTYLPWEGVDYYPLMNPHWIPADVNHDLEINIFDVVRITGAYGTTPASPYWNPHADIAQPFGKIDIFDIVLCTGHYGKKYP